MEIGKLTLQGDLLEEINKEIKKHDSEYSAVEESPESSDTWMVRIVGPKCPDGIWVSCFIGDSPEEWAAETFVGGFDPSDWEELI